VPLPLLQPGVRSSWKKGNKKVATKKILAFLFPDILKAGIWVHKREEKAGLEMIKKMPNILNYEVIIFS
jgi:hypothetical protein